ncbi:DUF3825 domain-containing protein [Anaerorhabdus furcosa]|uniref:DUF3825 domain-containing protein n=1 Tax=Anaerorhabdus furcosa TaxID=118967 RepID=A0A1T4LYQ1_9FIRM|nr:DUF3825 domain-containing protein [Anaerorhabdus furcosa]SJZ59787.1 protein of unknown function [Anaerorhabdus furcosa]
MKITDGITVTENTPLLRQVAFLGTREQYNGKLAHLAQLAEKETWQTKDSTFQNDILFQYILHTFDRLVDEDKIIFTEDGKFASFNTGLMSESGEDIVCMLNENTNQTSTQKWYLYGFHLVSDRYFLNFFNTIPLVADYFASDPNKMYFNPSYEIRVDTNHIFSDNIERFPKEITEKGFSYFITLFNGAFHVIKKKIMRNYRIVVPQYFNKQITYLLPIDLDGFKCALAIELLSNHQYRANTILTLDMAYSNARLLMKPEADWLDLNSIEISSESEDALNDALEIEKEA